MNKEESFIKGRTITLEGIKVQYCHLGDPDTKYKKKMWTCTLRLEEEMAKSMKAVGFNVRNTKDLKRFKEGDAEYFFLKCYSLCNKSDGTEMRPPFVKGRDGSTDIDGNTVGDGSLVNIKLWCKYMEVDGETHLPPYINGVQVLELVEKNNGGFSNVDEVASEDIPF